MGTKLRIGNEVTDMARVQVMFFSPISIPRSPFPHCPIAPFPVPRSPLPVARSSFPVPRFPFPVPLSPFLLPRFGNIPPRVSLAPGLSLVLSVQARQR